MIKFEEFKKLDLRIGKIIEAKKVEGSDNLLKLRVDLGENSMPYSEQRKRQLIAGIAKFYDPEQLIGKEIVVIVNLKPRMILGLESQGMLLAADIDGQPVILEPEKEVPPGTKIR